MDAAPPTKKRKTENSANAGQITILPDQLPGFKKINNLPPFKEYSSQVIHDGFKKLGEEENKVDVVCFLNSSKNTLFIQSTQFFQGVPKFLLKIFENYSFEAYHLGCKVFIQCLTASRCTVFCKHDQIDSAVHELSNLTVDETLENLLEMISNIGKKKFGEKRYSQSSILKSYDIFMTSRQAYKKFRACC